jgi:hypothetical protein
MNLLVTVGIRILELLFFVGWAGSLFVIILSGVEDVETVLAKNEERQPAVVIQESGTKA